MSITPTSLSVKAPQPPQIPAPVPHAVPPSVGAQVAAGNWLKEYVAAVLSIVIVSFTMYFMFKMFEAPDNVGQALWQHQSAILQVAVGLAGTVTGYYFGRIPAERVASTAQQAANAAQQSLANATVLAQQATANEHRIRTQVNDLRRQLSTPLGGGAAGAEVKDLIANVEHRLDQILRG